MSDGKSLFRRKSGYDGVDLRIKPNSDIHQIKYDLIRNMNPGIEIQSWEDLNRSLVDAMKMERLGTIVILCLIFLVAAFNLAAALTLISIQRMKEVGILRAMGAPTNSILKMIMQLGLSRAGKGALSGFVSAIFLVFIQTKFWFPSNKWSRVVLPEPAAPLIMTLNNFFLGGLANQLKSLSFFTKASCK